jgi:GntR family transcriptional regulator / MocR family aminotransferase
VPVPVPVMPRGIQRSEISLALQKETSVPLRIQLERGLREAIQKGRLSPGCMLPSTRVFASELGLSRGVVVEAYEQLLAEGYLCSRRGSSTYVADRPSDNSLAIVGESEAVKPPRYDLRPGRPDHSLFPRRQWLSAIRRAMHAAPETALDYPNARGALPARLALAAYLNRSRATAATAERMILCTGFAQGMRLVCEILKARGVRRIAVEDPGHAYESADVRASGLEMVPVPVDDKGVCVENLTRLKVGAAYVTPAHQYPNGSVLSAARRTALLAWAAKRDAFVIEDDYDGEYRYDREPIGALQGLSPERVIYIGSASKVLAPALRIGWLLSPQSLIQDLNQAKLGADRGSSVIDQLALAEFIEHGHLDRHLRRTRLIYSHRRAQLAASLRTHMPAYPVRGVAAGLHLTLELPRGADETAIVAEVVRSGIYVHGLSAYCSQPGLGQPALLLGYCRLREREINESARALAGVVSSFERSIFRSRHGRKLHMGVKEQIKATQIRSSSD